MDPDDLSRAWAKQAQLDAERGVIACRMCRRRAGLDETTTLWRDGVLVFALCDRCAQSHGVLMRPRADGIEVSARQRTPLLIGGRP